MQGMVTVKQEKDAASTGNTHNIIDLKLCLHLYLQMSPIGNVMSMLRFVVSCSKFRF